MKYTLMALLLYGTLLNAAPAFERERTFTQPDGTTFQGRLRGDEYLHWVETEEGKILVFNKKERRFEMGEIIDDTLKPSGDVFDPFQQMEQSITPDALRQLWQKKRRKILEFRQQR